jgi:hypothetical protein
MNQRINRCFAVMMASALPLLGAGRELTSDRPDATESPFTVEPGRVQIEASVAEYARDRHNPEFADVDAAAWAYAPVNIRVGLTARSEIQFVVDGCLDVKIKDRATGETWRAKGFGDVTLRAKWNLWGNDDGPHALGLMPFVKLPTADDDLGNDSVEGGIIVPFAAELPGGWGFGAMTEVDLVRNEADDGYDTVWVNTATVGRDLTEKIGMFVELFSEVGEGKPVLTFNAGLTYAVNEDFQLDCGLNLGLTRPADDLTVFAGFVKRF